MQVLAFNARVVYWENDTDQIDTVWLRCVSCGSGAVAWGEPNGGHWEVHPAAPIHQTPKHLPDEIEQAWEEAMQCFTASAFTASAMMCRKIIFHIAVDKGLEPENNKGRAPNFQDCVKHLVKAGLITDKQEEDWVDSIRVLGNTATHKLDSVSQIPADRALKFTKALLEIIYTHPAEAKAPPF